MRIRFQPRAKTLFYFLFVILLLPLSSMGKPGWLEDAVRMAKTQQFSDDAPALILHKISSTTIKANGKAKTSNRFAILILGPSGVDHSALSVRISNDVKVKKLKGWLVRKSGHEQKLKKEYIVEVAVDENAGDYNDDRMLRASFPDVKTGDIVAFEYAVEEKYFWDSFTQQFVFQKQLPVLWAEFHLTIPLGWKLHQSLQNCDMVTATANENVYHWEAELLPYLKKEKYMPDWGELYKRVRISCFDPQNYETTYSTNWMSVAEWTWLRNDPSAEPDAAITSLTHKISDSLKTTEEKIRALFTYVRDEIRYVAVEFGEGRFTPRGATTTCTNNYGDCKDKTALLRAMLKIINVPSVPVLVSVGSPVDPDFPSPFQFNHVIVGIPTQEIDNFSTSYEALDSGWLYIDPTDETTEFGDMPSDLYDSFVLRAQKGETGLHHLPAAKPNEHGRSYEATIHLNSNGSFNAKVTVIDYGSWSEYARRMNKNTQVTDQVSHIRKRLSKCIEQPEISDYRTESRGDSSWTSFTVACKNGITQSGNLHLLKADIFHPDISLKMHKTQRNFPIDFGDAATLKTEISWLLPMGYSLGSLPEDIFDTCASTLLQCSIRLSADTLTFLSIEQYNGIKIPPESYKEVRPFIRSLLNARRSKIFIEKE